MKKIYLILSASTLFAFSGCANNSDQREDIIESLSPTVNKVLVVKVDFLTNELESGQILEFGNYIQNITVSKTYQSPSDFGSLQLNYQETSQPLFSGTINWMSDGQMDYPNNLQPANTFTQVPSNTPVFPVGFDNVHTEDQLIYDFNEAWLKVQKLELVRNFLQSNPNQHIKYFLYTPGLGIGNPAKWDWIVYIKN